VQLHDTAYYEVENGVLQMIRFTDKVVVITGGNSGIGFAAALEFFKEGAKVVVTGRNAATLAETQKALDGKALVLAADIRKTADLEKLFQTVKDKFGKIDVLFVNAGIAKLAPLAETTEQVFDEIFDTNIRGAYFTVQKALPLIGDGGAIVFTTSWFDESGIAGTSAVSATKAALRSVTRTLAAELVSRNIRVNAVSPGVIETPLFGKLGLPETTVQEIGKDLLAQIPQKRFGTAAEVAKVVTFLASQDASYMTGAELAVDGGRTQL
jgi:NAD(P)-dependent dehydrogenase (short-subunit alcohol dehydrogenase family)